MATARKSTGDDRGDRSKVEWREDPLGLDVGVPQPRGFSTMSVNQFLRSDAIIQQRDGTPRPSYKLERFRIVTKRIRIRANSQTAKSVKALLALLIQKGVVRRCSRACAPGGPIDRGL